MLNQRTFRKNRGRNLVAVLAILMTTMMFTTLFTLAQSMNKNLIEMTFRQTGYDAQTSFKTIAPEQAERLAAHSEVKELGQSIVLGLAENKQLAGHQTEIRWADESYAKHSFAMPSEGGLPQKRDEIALDTLTLDKLGVEHQLGEKVTLEWRKDLSAPDGEVISPEFTLCGFWEGNASSYSSMAWVSREYADEMTGGNYNQEGQVFRTVYGAGHPAWRQPYRRNHEWNSCRYRNDGTGIRCKPCVFSGNGSNGSPGDTSYVSGNDPGIYCWLSDYL